MNEEKVKNKTNRKKYFLVFFSTIIVATIAYFVGYHFLYASKMIETDNAYTKADLAQIISKIAAPVKDVNVIDTQYVQKGDILVVLDDTDAKIALEKAKANLEYTKRKVKQLMSNDTEFEEKIKLNNTEIETAKTSIEKAKIKLVKAQKDLNRYKQLLKTKSVSKQAYDDVKLVYDSAKADLKNAQSDLKSSIASKIVTQAQKESNHQLIDDKTIEYNPEVMQALASFDKAKVDLERTLIKAPISGVVVQKNVKVGQYVNTSTQLLNIVPIDKIYVDANFKENKLQKVKVGQKVELYSDIYGKDVIYHGVVEGISSATGSALSLIPAQNATGNWIKVVQRLPIRVKLQKDELAKNPLYVGLSMHAKVFLEN